jgi:hypothetical protein
MENPHFRISHTDTLYNILLCLPFSLANKGFPLNEASPLSVRTGAVKMLRELLL